MAVLATIFLGTVLVSGQQLVVTKATPPTVIAVPPSPPSPPAPPLPPSVPGTAFVFDASSLLAAAADSSAATIVVYNSFGLGGSPATVLRPGATVTVRSADPTACLREASASPGATAGQAAPCPTIDCSLISNALVIEAASISVSGIRFLNCRRGLGDGGSLKLNATSAAAVVSNVYFGNSNAEGVSSTRHTCAPCCLVQEER